MPVPIPSHEGRSRELLRQQFEVERELARRLMEAPETARGDLYSAVYDEFFQRVPHQPQLAQKADPEARRALVALQRQLVQPFLTGRSVFLEVGSGDCSLALDLASRVARVIAVEASGKILEGVETPANLQLIVAQAPPFAVPPESVDLVYSSHFIEHLHPDDARSHLAEAHRVLRPGGRAIYGTPNRLYGPHDISRYFEEEACGLHLKEYTHGELLDLFARAGFRSLRRVRGIGGPPRLRAPGPAVLAERCLLALPPRRRRELLEAFRRWRGAQAPFRPLEQVIVTGVK